jgi:hypothetical protein
MCSLDGAGNIHPERVLGFYSFKWLHNSGNLRIRQRLALGWGGVGWCRAWCLATGRFLELF